MGTSGTKRLEPATSMRDVPAEVLLLAAFADLRFGYAHVHSGKDVLDNFSVYVGQTKCRPWNL